MKISKSKKKHILVISQYFYPESFRINDMCQEWVRRGYKVTVLTGIPNYPHGRFFEGYGYTKKRREQWNGVEIIRIPLIPRGNHAIGLCANYLSFVITGFIWAKTTNIKADYVFTFEVSPMTQALIGVWYSKRYHLKNYLYVQDLWPENVEIITGIHSPAVIKPLEKMVEYIYKNCTDIFVTSPCFVDAVCGRKADRDKVHYWPQYAEEFYKPVKKKPVKEIPDDGAFKIIFTGNVGYAQGLDILPKTAELLKKQEILFFIVGDGRYLEEFKCEIKRLHVENMFRLIQRQPAERIPELLGRCNAAFLSFMDTKLFEMTIPAKLQSYMACGMPVVASAMGETKKIIEEAKCGVCSSTGDAEKLAANILQIMEDKDALKIMGNHARAYFETHFDKTKLMDIMDNYFI